MKRVVSFIGFIVFMVGCAHAPIREGDVENGQASYYAPSLGGRKTASGDRYHPQAMTAAHRTLPFGTRLEIRNLDNGRSVDVRVSDRGPFVDGRIVDVSYAAARSLGLIGSGVANVRIRIISLPQKP